MQSLKFWKKKKNVATAEDIAQGTSISESKSNCDVKAQTQLAARYSKLESKDSGFISQQGSPVLPAKHHKDEITVLHQPEIEVIQKTHSVDEKQQSKTNDSSTSLKFPWIAKLLRIKSKKVALPEVKSNKNLDEEQQLLASEGKYDIDYPSTTCAPLHRTERLARLDLIVECDEDLSEKLVCQTTSKKSLSESDVTENVLKSEESSSSSVSDQNDGKNHDSGAQGQASDSKVKWYKKSPFASVKSEGVLIEDESSLILTPGKLPVNLRIKKRKSKDRTEDEEKALKHEEIIKIMRGKIKLVPDFVSKYKLTEVLGDGAFGFGI